MVRYTLRLLSNEPLHEWGTKRTIIVINDPSELRDEQNNFLKNYDVITYESSTSDFVNELNEPVEKKKSEYRKNQIDFS